MNCTTLDFTVADIQEFAQEDTGFIAGAGMLAALSVALLFFGERLLRPAMTLVSGVGAGLATYVVSDALAPPCEVRLGAALLIGLIAGLSALCLFNAGLVLLAAASLATITHFGYRALPLEHVDAPFHLAGLSGYYCIAVGVAALVGVGVALCQRRKLVRASAALLGGGGLAALSHLLIARAGGTAPPLALLAVLLGTATGALAVQHVCRKRRATPVVQGVVVKA